MLKSGFALFHHQRRLAARVAGRVGAGEAEDLASEAVARSLARPAPDGRAEPWLETIFRNLLADRGRRWARRDQRMGAGAGAGGAVVQTPEQLVLAVERACAVKAALSAMPPELREAVEARFFAGQDYDQMAAARGITPTTARTRVHRGLARLRQALASVRALWPVGPGAPLVGALAPAALVALLVVAPRPPAPPSLNHEGATAAASGPARPRQPSTRTIAKDDSTPVVRVAPPIPGPRRARAAAPVADDAPVAVKRLDFEEDEVEGDLQQPGIILIDGNPRQKRLGSLIEIPRSFEPSMTKMIEDL